MKYIKGSESISIEKDSNIGILVSHGFTGTTSTMKSLCESFGAQGWSVECPRLPGHGTTWEDLSRCKYQDWIDELERSLVKLKENANLIFMVGLSMGGALTLSLASRHPEFKGIILINHLAVMKEMKYIFVPYLRKFIKSVKAIGNDVKNLDVKEITYDQTPLEGVYQLILLTKNIARKIKKIDQPVLIFKSKIDHVVPQYNVGYTVDRLSSNEIDIVKLDNSYHVATIDYDHELIVEKSIKFIKKNLGTN